MFNLAVSSPDQPVHGLWNLKSRWHNDVQSVLKISENRVFVLGMRKLIYVTVR
jgi:hypothetical protein